MTKDIQANNLNRYYIFFAGLGLFVLLVLSFGLYVIGNPFSQRDRRYDEKLEYRLQTLSNQVQSYHYSHRKLPSDLTEVLSEVMSEEYGNQSDIKTYNITYKTNSDTSYKLCATFKTSNYPICFENGMKKECDSVNTNYYDSYNFLHRSGNQCKTYRVEPPDKLQYETTPESPNLTPAGIEEPPID